ncbi:hypothetical protein ACFPQ6_04215 [Deinococcus petrolearius]|uniref:Uncharacterized protein n=2 Tax=Deinococcus petrolearius TaxID=1751295 RepID=A0ABW1DG10_9DEIO
MAQGRGGATRDTTRPVRASGEGSQTELRGEGQGRSGAATRRAGARPAGGQGARGSGSRGPGERGAAGDSGSAGGKSGPRRFGSAAGGAAGSRPGGERQAAPRGARKKPLPELKRVQLDAPAPDTVFVDRDGERVTFGDSNLKRVAADILQTRRKAWRYRPFSFPLFTDKGNEQSFHFDFYIYDAEDSVIRLILVVPHESREVWDRVGRFKRQYPMYTYELWTPERLAQLQRPRTQLGF